MATAVFGGSQRAASREFRGRTKTRGVLGIRRRLDAIQATDYVGQASRRYQIRIPHSVFHIPCSVYFTDLFSTRKNS